MRNRFLPLLLIAAFVPGLLIAGEYHGQSDVICSDCHTTHYSERGGIPQKAEPGGPFPEMLLVSSIDELCLSCHDGTEPTAPDILAPVTMYDGSGSEFSGAGFFSAQDGAISAFGHDLGVEKEVPYSNPPRNMILSCVSCHNPHSSANYRNILPNPDSTGGDISVLLGMGIFENARPAIPPDRNSSIAAYRSGNTGYVSGMTTWCSDCHNALSSDNPGGQPAHFQRHPSNVSFDVIGHHVNSAHWLSGTGDGFGTITGDLAEGVPRLKFQAPSSTDFNQSVEPAIENQVFCGSCHFAHGGPYQSLMTWPFKTSGAADLYSGCQQCHFK